jgi:histone acetyltransferase (RNA polymerase elongator complex component)
MKHINIPVFIPHLGCPNQCVFCNQRTISGTVDFDITRVRDIIEDSLSTVMPEDEVEIAFFGGSFTGIDRTLMIELLEIAYSYIEEGRVQSVRCSTRPDYISEEILEILGRYGVKVIELGLQSSSDRVLYLSKRGHSFEEEMRACKAIVDGGFTLVGQMMIGLPGSTLEDEIRTADFIISSGASYARIYPTVVFRDTELCAMTECGEYRPLSEDEAAERSAEVLLRFIRAGVPVIRLGLCASENLSDEETYFAGPNHPALGELAYSAVYGKIILDEAKKFSFADKDILKVKVAKGELSKAIGQKKRNKNLIKEILGVSRVDFEECDGIEAFSVKLLFEQGK